MITKKDIAVARKRMNLRIEKEQAKIKNKDFIFGRGDKEYNAFMQGLNTAKNIANIIFAELEKAE